MSTTAQELSSLLSSCDVAQKARPSVLQHKHMSKAPPHVLLEIFLHIAPSDLQTMALVCAHWAHTLRVHHQFYFYLRLERQYELHNTALQRLASRADAIDEMRRQEATARHRRACTALGLSPAPLDSAVSRFGRWFALYHMLPQWRLNEPAVRELRHVIEHYARHFAHSYPQLDDQRFRFAIEDCARREFVLSFRRAVHSAPVGATKAGGAFFAPKPWLAGFANNTPLLVAQINFSQVPQAQHLPNTGMLFVFCDNTDSLGHALNPYARFWPHELTEENSVLVDSFVTLNADLHSSSSSLSSTCSLDEADSVKKAMVPFAERVATFSTSVALPASEHPATPRALASSPAYLLVREWWLQSRGSHAQKHSMLGYSSSWDADRLIHRQQECDRVSLTSKCGHGCGRDPYGICGRRPLLVLSSSADLPFINAGRCVVWVDSRLSKTNTNLWAVFDRESRLSCTIE